MCSREFEVILNIHIWGVCMCKCQWSQMSKDPPCPGAGGHCPPSHPTSFTKLLYQTFRTQLALLENGVCKEQHSELLERSPLKSLAMTGQLKTIGPLHAKGHANQDTVSNPFRTVLWRNTPQHNRYVCFLTHSTPKASFTGFLSQNPSQRNKTRNITLS